MPKKPTKPVNASDRSKAVKRSKNEEDAGSVSRWKGRGKSDSKSNKGRGGGDSREDKQKKDSKISPENLPFVSRSAIKVRGREQLLLAWDAAGPDKIVIARISIDFRKQATCGF